MARFVGEHLILSYILLADGSFFTVKSSMAEFALPGVKAD